MKTKSPTNQKDLLDEVSKHKDIAWLIAAMVAVIVGLGWIARYIAIASLYAGPVDFSKEPTVAAGIVFLVFILPLGLAAPIIKGSFQLRLKYSFAIFLTAFTILGLMYFSGRMSLPVHNSWRQFGYLYGLSYGLIVLIGWIIDHSRLKNSKGSLVARAGIHAIAAPLFVAFLISFSTKALVFFPQSFGGFPWDKALIRTKSAPRTRYYGSVVFSDNQGVLISVRIDKDKNIIFDSRHQEFDLEVIRIPWGEIISVEMEPFHKEKQP